MTLTSLTITELDGQIREATTMDNEPFGIVTVDLEKVWHYDRSEMNRPKGSESTGFTIPAPPEDFNSAAYRAEELEILERRPLPVGREYGR